MTLTPEQQAEVSRWIAAGDNLSAVQKKLREQFSLSLTYKDTRFLVDDLNLNIKDAAPKADANDVAKAMPPKPPVKQPSQAARKKEAAPEGRAEQSPPEEATLADEEQITDEAIIDEDLMDDPPADGPSSVTVDMDKVTLHPGALASGTVTFSDGVTGKWIVDNYGRPGFTEVSQPGYRPKPADAQAFMQELSQQLQKKGYG